MNGIQVFRRLMTGYVSGIILLLKFDFKRDTLQSTSRVVKIESRTPLSNNQWHRVTLEHISREIMVTLDDIRNVYSLSVNEELNILTFDERVTIGGTLTEPQTAYIGCLRQFYLDGRRVKLRRLVESAKNPGIVVGCQDHCSSSPCEHGGICIENYETTDFYCVCKQPMIYYGPRCEIGCVILVFYNVETLLFWRVLE
ncbi:unnamed protein product [Soboliphyme baturini]|uniref:EGF-like domain-containing protein n=1 Tax=Soboliphyme baturini TaxID=241478 RepID=A0A183JAX3_9BILA|nr:unnamed protein product [Soboliphyme baturini]